MSLFSVLSATRGRKLALAAFSATVIGAAVAPTSASAFPIIKPYPIKPCCYGGGWGKGWGYGGAALGGFALGAVAASAASGGYGGGYGGGDCYMTRQRTYDDYGNVYIRRVRVCE